MCDEKHSRAQVSMRICGYCGCENSDGALQCRECGTVFAQGQNSAIKPDSGEGFNRPISIRLKWYLWSGAWAVVILATLAINPANLLTAPSFPLGLIALLPRGEGEAVATAWLIGIPLIVGWGIYAMLFVLILRTRKRIAFLFVYVVFAVLLGLNLAGCQRALEAASQIR